MGSIGTYLVSGGERKCRRRERVGNPVPEQCSRPRTSAATDGEATLCSFNRSGGTGVKDEASPNEERDEEGGKGATKVEDGKEEREKVKASPTWRDHWQGLEPGDAPTRSRKKEGERRGERQGRPTSCRRLLQLQPPAGC